MPASRPSITPKKCGRLPAPDVAYDDFPGFAFAHTTYSVHVFAPDCGPAATANWNVEPMPIGAKSLSGSYESVLYVCGTTAIGPIGITMIVVPSGAAAFKASAAMRPMAPGRFSTMTGCPSVSFILSATTRAITSAVPPAGNPTRILTGRSIFSCAQQVVANTASASIVAAIGRFIISSEGVARRGAMLTCTPVVDNMHADFGTGRDESRFKCRFLGGPALGIARARLERRCCSADRRQLRTFATRRVRPGDRTSGTRARRAPHSAGSEPRASAQSVTVDARRRGRLAN